MNPIQIFFHVVEITAIVLLYVTVNEIRAKVKEQRQPKQQPTFKAPQPVQEWQRPIEGFEPKKPETLRPGQMKGREVEEREFEFDVKVK